MLCSKIVDGRPLAYCVPCSERTPHRYERLGVNGRLTSRAICLICNNDSRRGAVQQSGTASSPQADRVSAPSCSEPYPT